MAAKELRRNIHLRISIVQEQEGDESECRVRCSEIPQCLKSATSQRTFNKNQFRYLLAVSQGVNCNDGGSPIMADHLNPLTTHGDS
jgi:hypothetical protein